MISRRGSGAWDTGGLSSFGLFGAFGLLPESLSASGLGGSVLFRC